MSFWTGWEERAVVEAIDACDRLAPQLLDLLARHEHAASLARVDWEGPHHDRFENEVLDVRRALIDGQVWVRHLHVELLAAYAAMKAAERAAAAAVPLAATHR